MVLVQSTGTDREQTQADVIQGAKGRELAEEITPGMRQLAVEDRKRENQDLDVRTTSTEGGTTPHQRKMNRKRDSSFSY